MTNNNEFKIESRKEDFRVMYISPVDMLALSTSSLDLNNFSATRELYNYALEHIEVKMGETWAPVKSSVKGKEVYMPFGMENDYIALNELCTYFLTEVVVQAFTKSSESA